MYPMVVMRLDTLSSFLLSLEVRTADVDVLTLRLLFLAQTQGPQQVPRVLAHVLRPPSPPFYMYMFLASPLYMSMVWLSTIPVT